MNSASPVSGRVPVVWPLAGVLAAVLLLFLWFLVPRLHYYVEFAAESVVPYFADRRGGLLPHVYGGLVAVLAGLVQLWLGLTGRTGAWHRRMGRVYVAAVCVGGLAGLYLVLTIPNGPFAYQAGLLMLNVAWLLTTGMAIWAIRRRNLLQHREWMIRSYVVTLAFVTYRVGEELLLKTLGIEPRSPQSDDIASLMAWACWAVPLLIAEPLIQSRRLRRPMATA